MTDCGCEKAKAELEEYLHNELCREDVADITEHMRSCDDCSAEAEVGRVLMQAIQRACQEKAPADLRSHVLERIREVQSSH